LVDLHPWGCTCGDCRNRRLICGLDAAGEGYPTDGSERSGSVLKREKTRRADERRQGDAGRRPAEVQRL
jgi:hypothetical protein